MIQQFWQQLSEHIWKHYEIDLCELLGPFEAEALHPRPPQSASSQIDLFEPEPFDSDDSDWPF